ncbi:MAG: DinB family protein [Nocardioides sp.]
MTSDPTPDPLDGPPQDGSEIDTLVGALERNRRTFAWKCSGLDADSMRRTVGASTITLGGLLKHLALVEDEYLTHQLTGADGLTAPFDQVDFDAEPDWEWRTAADDSPEELLGLWEDCVARSRRHLAAAYAGGPDALSALTWGDGTPPSVRRLVVDLVEEYARHTGHADLIRESIDGLGGEGLPSTPAKETTYE